MAKWVFINDGFVKEEKALLHFSDLSFQRGYGIFDFFRLKGNEPLFIEDHLDRFYRSAEGMHLPVALERHELKAIISSLVEKNQLPNTGIRLSLTGGYSADGFSIGKPNFVISQHSFTLPTKEQIEKGIKLLSYQHQRQLPHIKSIDYLIAIWLQPLKNEKGADDILYCENSLISELPRSNFFIVTQDETIVTPANNALKGITRKYVIEIAKQHFAVEERDVLLEELKTAKEAFITSTTKQILPVAQVDDVVFRENKIALQLSEIFRSTYMQ